jgi:hypothetical protein
MSWKDTAEFAAKAVDELLRQPATVAARMFV